MSDRFILQPSSHQKNWWVCTDTENGIVCRFQAHRFNETSQMNVIKDTRQSDPLFLARLAREMGDWLGLHHEELLF